MISQFFTTTYTVKRLSWTTDGSGNQYSTLVAEGTFKGHIQQADPDLVQNLGLSLTKTYALWCPTGTDVLEGDTVTDGTDSYTVRAVMEYANGDNAHLELIIEKAK